MEVDCNLAELLAWDPAVAFPTTPSTLDSSIPLPYSSQLPPENANGNRNGPTTPVKSQVCSSCRRRKRKCSLERPSCALCRENKWMCDYGWVKKKPGPVKGSVGSKTAVSREQSSLSQHALPPTPVPTTGLEITLNQETRNKMLDLYFTHIHIAYPMICRKLSTQALAAGTFPDKLLNAMFATASVFVPVSEIQQFFGSALNERPGDAFARLAMEQHREQKESNDAVSLDDVKTEVLLTIYEYTNFPGRRAWMMAGNLVRLAYGLELHRLDCDSYNESLTDFEMEERRFVWWAVWKLDSAINTLTSTPFGVDAKVNCTAFVSTSTADFVKGTNAMSTQQFLPSDCTKLWKSASMVLNTDADDGRNMYLLAVSFLRAASECAQRLHSVPSADVVNQLMTLRNTLSCLRLTLPPWYFEPPRHSSTETLERHWLRLESLLILYCGHIQLFLPWSSAGKENISDDALQNWKICVSVAEDIAAIFHHWQPKYFMMADPMISTVIWLAYLTLTLHSMCNYYELHKEDGQVQITNSLDLLSLALDNFAQYWPLSRLLRDSTKDLQTWAWLKIEFSDLLWLVAQLRVPIDPLKRKPGTIDMWNILGRLDPAMPEANNNEMPKD